MTIATQTPERTGAGFRWWYPLTLTIPAAGVLFYLNRFGENPGSLSYWVFGMAVVSLIPLANWIGASTDALSKYVGDRLAGLLDATFGNVPELAIGFFLLYHSFAHPGSLESDHEIIKGLIIGSVINNVLLVLGASVFVAALRHGRLRFSPESAAGFSSMLALAVVGLALPTLAYSFTSEKVKESGVIEGVSLAVGVILILSYVAYIGASVFHWREKVEGGEDEDAAEQTPVVERREVEKPRNRRTRDDRYGMWIAVVSLTAASVATVLIAYFLVEETNVVIKLVDQLTPPSVGLITPLSVGLIIFPLFCNVGEFAGVVGAAIRREGEKMMDIAGGSAVQVPLLVAPALIFISFVMGLLTGTPALFLNLRFDVFPLIAIGLVTIVYALVSLDGESTWLEGLQLIAIYLLVAVTALALPA
jgi:Ca2+:H+ antiporter